MITSYDQALSIQVNRAKQGKAGIAKGVKRYLVKTGLNGNGSKAEFLREAREIAFPVEVKE